MPYVVYILQSESTGRYYCGQTDDLPRCVHQHNDPEYRGSLTTERFAGPWALLWTRDAETRSEAITLERKIKTRRITRYLDEYRDRQLSC